MPPVYLLPVAIVLTPVGIWAAGATAIAVRRTDPQIVVIDEVLGQWLTLAAMVHINKWAFILGLALFRIFDITKPWPVRNLERLHGGLGIIADDLMAGVYGAIVLFLAGHYNLV